MIHHHPINEEHENKSHESIKAPFDAGYTLFDLSDVYSDGLLGEVFSRTLKEVSGMREQIVICHQVRYPRKRRSRQGCLPPLRSLKGSHHPIMRGVAQAVDLTLSREE